MGPVTPPPGPSAPAAPSPLRLGAASSPPPPGPALRLPAGYRATQGFYRPTFCTPLWWVWYKMAAPCPHCYRQLHAGASAITSKATLAHFKDAALVAVINFFFPMENQLVFFCLLKLIFQSYFLLRWELYLPYSMPSAAANGARLGESST